MNKKVKVLILSAPGTNCDGETIFAMEEAGGSCDHVPIGALIRGEKKLSNYQIMVIPGGFSYGDDISAGKVLANELKLKLNEEVPEFVVRGGLILGVCNGFQVLVKTGILPGFTENGRLPLTLTNNDSGRFECRWVNLTVENSSPCIFTRGIEKMYLPVAHGEGKLVATPGVISKIRPAVYYEDANGKRTMEYPANPNGSADSIAGICDETGRVFGLMPHPERYVRATQSPLWTRNSEKPACPGDGLKVYRNAVEWAEHR
jgi:phosphoribosylformylglycinamidine synthase I